MKCRETDRKPPISKRINIVLPDKTLAVLNRVSSKGARSSFIDRAVRHLVETEQSNLRDRLKAEALANSDRDLLLAAEWYPGEARAIELTRRAIA